MGREVWFGLLVYSKEVVRGVKTGAHFLIRISE